MKQIKYNNSFMEILIGTKNQYKATETASFLANCPGIKVHFWEEFGLEIKIEEDQPTLKKNAEKKGKLVIV